MLEEHRRRSDLVPFFFNGLRAKAFARARSSYDFVTAGCGPRLWLSDAGKSEAQPPGALPSPGAACAGGAPTRPRPRARAVRPARGNPWGRSGRLHAPEAARTGPVNALRRYCTVSREGAGSNGHNGHFFGQPGRDHLGTSPGGYGSGFNGPRAVLKSLPTAGETGRATRALLCDLYARSLRIPAGRERG